MEKKTKGIEGMRLRDEEQMEKYKAGQRSIQELLSKNISETDDRVSLNATNIKKIDQQIFQLQIDKETLYD